MKGRTMTNTEYLLRTVRESEHMPGWQDSFAKMREDISKEFSENELGTEKETFNIEEEFEM